LNQFKATKSDPPCKMQTSFTEGGERHKSFMACPMVNKPLIL